MAMTKDQIIPIAKSIQSPMWEWHVYAAYLILFAFSVRIIYMIMKGIKFPNPFTKGQTLKDYLQGFTYLLFYLLIAISTFTGFYLKWFEGDWKEPLEAIHKWAIYWFPIFIFLHLGGIVLAELTNKKGITSKMIGGDE